MSKNSKRFLRDDVLDVYSELYCLLSRHTVRINMAGSLRRHTSSVGDLDIVVIPCQSFYPMMVGWGWKITDYTVKGKRNIFTEVDFVKRKIGVEIYTTTRKSWGACLLYATGSKEFNIEMRGTAKRQGFILNRHGVWRNKTYLSGATEKDVFDFLKLGFIKPEERESLSSGGDVLFRENVPSRSYWNVQYLVTYGRQNGWSCQCPDFVYRRAGTGQVCKHIAQMQKTILQ